MRMSSNSTGLVAVIAGLALAACGNPNVNGPNLPPSRFLTPNEVRVSAANTEFGFELLQRVHDETNEPNVLISPLSASMALGMAMNGARSATYDAMRATLGFGGLTEDEVNEAYRGLIQQLRLRDERVEFQLANSVWARQGFPIEAPFLDVTQTHFDAEVRELDFSSPGAPGVINAWVDEKTGGRITEIVDQIDPHDILFLINAVYFKAPWSSPFDEHGTQPREFRTLDGKTVQVPTMLRDGPTLTFQNSEVTVVDLPYADSAFSMTLVMPAGDRTLDQVIESLTSERWNAWTSGLTSGRVMLLMPKFRFEFDTSLKPALADMGMGIAFQPFQADFGRITRTRDDVHISEVKQKAFIDVHELGTEAAAVTSIAVSVTSAPPVIHLDRPFLFAIRERESNTLLFIGRIGDPSA